MARDTCVLFALSIGIFTTSALAQCDGPLGFENGNITDDQFSYSGGRLASRPEEARLNVGKGWALVDGKAAYLQVDLLTQRRITGYSIQGGRYLGRQWYSMTLAMFYSQEGIDWKRYISSDGNDTLEGNTDATTTRTFNLTPSVQARFVAFAPVKWSSHPGLRLELYGCDADEAITVNYTVVTNDIEDSQEWLLNQSPFIVNSMVNIKHTGRVKVQAGVKIIFGSDGGLKVSGNLEANGLTENPIVFTSKLPGLYTHGRWLGIEVLNQGELTLDHCVVREGVYGIKGPLSSITVRLCHIHHNEIGLDLSMGDTDSKRTQLAGTHVTDNVNYGISCQHWIAGHNFVRLNDCQLSRNGRTGAFLYDGSIVMTADNSIFSHNDYGTHVINTHLDLTIQNCTYMHNLYGLYYTSYSYENLNFTVDNSKVKENTYGITLYIDNASYLIITNSDLSNNKQPVKFYGRSRHDTFILFSNNTVALTFQERNDPVEIACYGYGIYNISVTVENNFFNNLLHVRGVNKAAYMIINNTFNSLAGEKGLSFSGGNISILNNRFNDCTSHSVIYTQGINTVISGNSFQNPKAQYDVMTNIDFNESSRINASYNYWGSNNRFHVRSRIYDFFSDMNLVITDVHPFYISENLTELSAELDPNLFSFRDSDKTGGILTESVTLDPNQYLFVTRSLYIPEGYKLVILQNVTLVFPNKQGIFVKGVLETCGRKDGLVLLTNHRTDDNVWSGVIYNSTGSVMEYTALKKSHIGIRISTNSTGVLIITDSIITQCNTAVFGQLWGNVSLSLHRVIVNETSRALSLEKHIPHTVFIDFLHCDFYGKTYMHSDDNVGKFSLSIASTIFKGQFELDSCGCNISMNVSNSSFYEESANALLVKGGPLDFVIRNISVSGRVALLVCSFSGIKPGIVDIQNSTFRYAGRNYDILTIGTLYKYNDYAPHRILFVNNMLYSTLTDLTFGISQYSSSWTIDGTGNMLNGTGIRCYGSIWKASFDRNTFIHSKTALKTNIRCNIKSTIIFMKNTVHGGTLTFFSARNNDTFSIQGNLFNGSEIILQNPLTVMNGNTFLSGSEYDIKFVGEGYADREINCTLNYWDTNDRTTIDKRLYDSSYDEMLPTFIFVPFFEVKYNCSETFYGPKCLPYMNILNIIPNAGPQSGGTSVHIWGHNFPETKDDVYHCRFDMTVVNGTWLSNKHVVCSIPQHPSGEVTVEISTDGQQFTRNKTKFVYYEACYPGLCMENTIPPQGSCLQGECLCLLPWSGKNCSTELKAPVISLAPEKQVAAENEEYRLQPMLIMGNEPIEWFLNGAPSGMQIDPRTGLLHWKKTVASMKPYSITLIAANYIGHSQVVLSLTVPLSYNVTIDELIPSGILAVPKSVKIKGHVNSSIRQPIVVDIKIRKKGEITSSILVSTTLFTPDTFEAVYFPSIGDSGLFEVDGRHPSDNRFSAQRRWSVLGMKCLPGYTSRQAYLDTGVVEIKNVTVLRNVGVDKIRNISVSIVNVEGPLSSVFVRVNNNSSHDVARPFIQTLEPNTELVIDLILMAFRPFHSTIGVVFVTPEGTVARMSIALQIDTRKPFLITSTKSLNETLSKGSQKTFQVQVMNVGNMPAHCVRVSLPFEPRLNVASFSNSQGRSTDNGLTLLRNDTAILTLTVTSGSSDPLGEFSGSVVLNSDFTSVSIPYRFYVTSIERLNVTVRVEDEFSYFASDKPLVSNASVTLKNPMKGYSETRTTTKSGQVVFENVVGDQYTLQATAPGHSSYSAVIIAKPSDSSFSIFLQRVAVTYTWTVTPTTFDDKYIITLDSTFETQVPMPVVTVEPAIIDIIAYEEGEKDVINFNITNHGLIRADNVRLLIPKDHSTLTFTQTVDPIGPVPANTSIIVQVLVKAKTRVKGDRLRMFNCILMLFDYVCGQTRTGGQDITLTRPGRPPLPCAGVWGRTGEKGTLNWIVKRDYRLYGVGGDEIGDSVPVDISWHGFPLEFITSDHRFSIRPSTFMITYSPMTPLNCEEKCAKSLLCLAKLPPFFKCGLALGGLNFSSGVLQTISSIVSIGFSCILKPLNIWNHVGKVWGITSCLYAVGKDCLSPHRERRETNTEAIHGVIDSNLPIHNFFSMMKELYGGDKMFFVQNNSWMNTFYLGLAEDSVAGHFLSRDEITSITASLNTSLVPTVHNFLLRWNNTVTAWEDGTLATLGPTHDVISYNNILEKSEQFRKDTEKAKQRGFDSIFDDFNNAVHVVKTKEEQASANEGVCAMVRVRIIQELVLTRDAFNARLEIENGEQSALENIAVTINIWKTYGNRTFANDEFSFGNVSLVGITAVGGTGTLEQDVSGTAEWLIIPYSTAAAEEDTLYDVGGTISYTVSESTFSIPLLPDTIIVKPNPSLVLNYFHERYVQGDDPMTVDVTEPVVPFTLAVMVSNGAYGIARHLQIISGQPEITENEKGLLVSFNIIGAQLGTDPVTHSLTMDFGDIESFQTKTARWLLTSPLRGKFFNYTATFENINPLGDPQLSIMESVGYHQLIHLVRLESTGDDLDDFLVNDVTDPDEMADRVYDSSDGFNNSQVVSTVVNNFSLQKTEFNGNKPYTYINLSVTVPYNGSGYIYTRLVNNLTKDSISECLLGVTRGDNKKILIDSNAWQTNYYHDKLYLHVFDFVSNMYASKTIHYSLLFGPRPQATAGTSKSTSSLTSTSVSPTSTRENSTSTNKSSTATPNRPTSKTPTVTSNRPSSTSKSPTETSNRPTSTSKSPTVTSNRPTSTSKSPTVTSNRPTSTSKSLTMTSNRPTSTSKSPTVTSNRPTNISERPTVTSNRPTSTSKSPTLTSHKLTSLSESPTVTFNGPTSTSKSTSMTSNRPTSTSKSPTNTSESSPSNSESPAGNTNTPSSAVRNPTSISKRPTSLSKTPTSTSQNVAVSSTIATSISKSVNNTTGVDDGLSGTANVYPVTFVIFGLAGMVTGLLLQELE